MTSLTAPASLPFFSRLRRLGRGKLTLEIFQTHFKDGGLGAGVKVIEQ
jgi:hypothetical protein